MLIVLLIKWIRYKFFLCAKKIKKYFLNSNKMANFSKFFKVCPL